MSGINYDLHKIRGMAFDVDGVLSPSTIPMDSEGTPMRMVNIKDGYAMQLAVKLGFHIAIITGGNTEAVRVRFHSLGVEDIYLSAANKLEIFTEWMSLHDLKPEEVMYMGDDIPHLKCLRAAGLPCCPNDAAWEVKQTAQYISRFGGGYGCGRDVMEQIIKAHGLWMKDAKAFGW